MPRGAHTVAPDLPDLVGELPDLVPVTADPEVGDSVHYVAVGSHECTAAIITRLCPPAPGVPASARVDLRAWPAFMPNGTNINAADYDPTHRAGGTWHHRGHG